MTITIVGCGALGSLIASRFIAAGYDVQVLQRPGAQLDALRRNGVTIEAKGGRTRYPLSAVSDNPADLMTSRLIVVLVKTYGTTDVAPAKEILADDGIALTLQNGLGAPDELADIFGEDRMAAGVTMFGAYTVQPGITGFGGEGDTVLGPWKAGIDVAWVADTFEKSDMEVKLVADPNPAIWSKLVINAMINPVSALTRLRVGEVRESPLLIDLMRHLGGEAVEAASRAHVEVDFDDIWSRHEKNLVRTEANKTSMLQDIEAGRQTEIDAISGSVLKYARDDHDLPYTQAIYALIKTMDNGRVL